MKRTKLTAIFGFLLSIFTQAQSVKHQSEIIRNMVSKGDYKIVADLYNSHRGVVNISDIKFDKNQPNEHFEIFLKKYPNHPRESDRNATYTYFPDHIAYPITYYASNYEGNKKLQDKVGYVVRNGKYTGEDRIVFLDNYLFMLQKWKDKDNYEIRWVVKIPKTTEGVSESANKEKPKKKKCPPKKAIITRQMVKNFKRIRLSLC